MLCVTHVDDSERTVGTGQGGEPTLLPLPLNSNHHVLISTNPVHFGGGGRDDRTWNVGPTVTLLLLTASSHADHDSSVQGCTLHNDKRRRSLSRVQKNSSIRCLLPLHLGAGVYNTRLKEGLNLGPTSEPSRNHCTRDIGTGTV